MRLSNPFKKLVCHLWILDLKRDLKKVFFLGSWNLISAAEITKSIYFNLPSLLSRTKDWCKRICNYTKSIQKFLPVFSWASRPKFRLVVAHFFALETFFSFSYIMSIFNYEKTNKWITMKVWRWNKKNSLNPKPSIHDLCFFCSRPSKRKRTEILKITRLIVWTFFEKWYIKK